MIEFYVLGSIWLRREGGKFDHAFLKGPKRLALLAYLILAQDSGFHRRDKLLALFWPELGQQSARNALSNMLYHIREALGKAIIINRGTEEVKLDSEKIWCDAIAFVEACKSDQNRKAINLYRDDLLPGLHVTDTSNEFQNWLDAKRELLRQLASDAAWAIAEEEEQAGNQAEAGFWAKKAARYTPFSQEIQIQLINLLKRNGDQTGAMEAYRDFLHRLKNEWDMEPSEKLKAAVKDLSPPKGLSAPIPSDDSNRKSDKISQKRKSKENDQVSDELLASTKSWSQYVTNNRFALGLFGLLIMAITLGWIFWDNSGNSRKSVLKNEQSVAVLPFNYIGHPDSTDYFSLGMTEEILTRLAQVSDLSVISRTSVMQYKYSTKSLQDIGEELGAGAIVEGSIQQIGNKVHITAQLIDANTDRHLWGASYNRELKNILEVQTEVATNIAEALKAVLLPTEMEEMFGKRTVDKAAYHLYLRGRHIRDLRKPSDMEVAASLFNKSIASDSTFAPAHAALAMTTVWLGLISRLDPDVIGNWGISPNQAVTEAMKSANRTLSIDSTVVEAYIAKGLVFELFEHDYVQSERAFRKAIKNNPSHNIAREQYGWQLLRTGRIDSAILQMKRAVAVDPLSWDAHHSLGYAYYCNRNYEDAVQQLQTALDLGSQYPITQKYLITASLKRSQQLYQQGENEEALTMLNLSDALLSRFYQEDPQREKLFERIVTGNQGATFDPNYESSLSFPPHLYALLLGGQKNRAIELLSEDTAVFNFRVPDDPLFDAVRDDPQFKQLIEKKFGQI